MKKLFAYIRAYWKKKSCNHEWISHHKQKYHYSQEYNSGRTYEEDFITEILICKNCGTIKKIKY